MGWPDISGFLMALFLWLTGAAVDEDRLTLDGDLLVRVERGSESACGDLDAKLASASEVKAVVPFIEGEALAARENGGDGVGVIVRGMDRAGVERIAGALEGFDPRGFDGFETGGDAAVGEGLAKSLDLDRGAELKLVHPTGRQTDQGPVPSVIPVFVVARLNTGAALDGQIVLVERAAAQKLIPQASLRQQAAVFLKRPLFRATARQALAGLLPPCRATIEDVREPWLPRTTAAQ